MRRLITILLLVLLQGCSQSPDSPPIDDFERLIGARWVLRAVMMDDGRVIVPPVGSIYDIEFFRDGTLKATSDCNDCNGEYQTVDHQLDMFPRCTESGCGPDYMVIPGTGVGSFAGAILYANRYEISGDTLYLYFRDQYGSGNEHRLQLFGTDMG